MTTIWMSNLGYLRGFDGSLKHHLSYAYRHFYCSPEVEQQCLLQLRENIIREDPDLCCFVEIDRTKSCAQGHNQMEALASAPYSFFDIDNKYGPSSPLRLLPCTRNRCNGFLSKRPLPYEKMFFSHGVKRLIYRINIQPGLTLYFAHFSLSKVSRTQQLLQISQMICDTPGEIILMGDFNVHEGCKELAPLIAKTGLVLLNRQDVPTFRFHTTRLTIDLCLCSPEIAAKSQLSIIPQTYSDHDALVLRLGEHR